MEFLDLPGQSLDLILLQILWLDLKQVNHAQTSSTVPELKQCWENERAKIPLEWCKTRIAHYWKRLIAVVATEGDMTIY